MAKKTAKKKRTPRQSTPQRADAGASGGATREELGRCVKCQSTNLKVLRRLKDQHHNGRNLAGEPYTRVVRRRCKCDDCGQHQMKLSREYHPSEWRE
jgi:hypothetical protein